MKRYIFLLLIILSLPTVWVSSQTVLITYNPYEYKGQWYFGKDGGIPLGFSSFSSFGVGHKKLGWSAGMYGGYYFNTTFGLEAYMMNGKVKQTAQQSNRYFWLSQDENCYFYKPQNIDGWQYDNLKTDVKIQLYGLRGNIDILGLFNATKGQRWTIGLLPQIALVGTKATLRTVDYNTKVIKHHTQWHFGVGGNLNFGFKISKNWAVGIYSGITYLTGKSLDSTPKIAGHSNYIWDNGIRINIIFGRKARLIKEAEEYIGIAEDYLHIVPTHKTTILVDENGTPEVVEAEEYPAIYFPIRSVMIEHDQAYKIHHIAQKLKKAPHLKILISGYADDGYNLEQSSRYARQRAQAVKRQLMNENIAEELINIEMIPDDKVQLKGNCVIVDIIPE